MFLAKRIFHTKSTSPDHVGPGSYNYLPKIATEGHKYSMSFTNTKNMFVSPNEFVPGPKYLVQPQSKKPPFCR